MPDGGATFLIRALLAGAAALLLLCNAVRAEETIALANGWNRAVQLTGQREAKWPTADLASPGWMSADWVLEPAPPQRGASAVYIRNAWRKTYLTYAFEYRPDEAPTNARLMARIERPQNRQQTLLADGQVWLLEPSPTMPLRAHSLGPLGLRPAVTDDHPIVRRQVEDPRPPSVNNDNSTLTERKSLFFASCETAKERMVAVVRLVGKAEVTNATNRTLNLLVVPTRTVPAPPVAGAAFLGFNEPDRYLRSKPDTVYIGVPGKIKVTGTLYDAKVEEVRSWGADQPAPPPAGAPTA